MREQRSRIEGKMARVALCAACCMVLCMMAGCAVREYASLEEARQDGARMGERILIDGADVSGMSVEEAAQAVRAAQQQRLEEMRFTISAGEGTADVSGAELPVRFDTEYTLLAALSQPRQSAQQSFQTPVRAELEQLRAALAPAAQSLEIPPADAAAEYDQEAHAFVYAQEQPGRRLPVQPLAEQALALLQAGTGGTLAAEPETVEPEYTLAEAQADTALLAEFSTSFAGGTYGKANRVYNICKAAELLDGVRLAPLEELDMNSVLGARTGENGWKKAAAIRDAAYVQEYGGGVCQVSSTLYNAVLLADLEVTERSHHSWPLGYVDAGRDATISTGGPNFKFKNTSGSPLVVSAFADRAQKTVTVRLYGRAPEGGGSIKLSSKKIKTLEDLGVEEVVDVSLAPGTSETVRKKRRGCVTETYKHYYDAAGELVRTELVTTDKYRSVKGLVRVSAY